MRYINTFNSMTDFNKDKQTNLNQPRVALVKENGGGVDKLFYIKFKIYEMSKTSYLNGLEGNEISEDIPVKTSVNDLYNDETLRRIYIDNFDRSNKLTNVGSSLFSFVSNLIPHLTVTPDSLDLIENGKLITKFTLTGLKRKNSDVRDFVGEIACYLNSTNNPILLKVDRSNPEHPTIQYLSSSNILQVPEVSKYMENHEIEKRTKCIVLYNDHL